MKFWIAAAVICSTFVGYPALGQNWPSKPIRLMIGSGAGSAPDIVGRILGERLGSMWGQNLVAENRIGAAGNLAAQQVMRSAPDGYTLWFSQGGPLTVNQFLFKNLGFDPEKDFLPVAFVGASPMLLAASPALGANTLQEVIALAKANPGKLALGTPGINGAAHLIGEAFFRTAGVTLLVVNYKAVPQMTQAAMVNEVQVVVGGSASILPHRQSGKLKMLGVSTPKRLAGMEEIATMSEAVPGFSIIGYFAVIYPAGVPPELVARVNRDANNVLNSPAVLSRLSQLGIFPHEGVSNGSPEALANFLRSDRQIWHRVTQQLNIQPE